MRRYGFYPVFYDPFQGRRKGFFRIAVQPEYEAGIDHDSPVMDGFYRLCIVPGMVLYFMDASDGRGMDAFKTDEQALAAAFLHQVKQIRIEGGIDGNSGIPF